MTIDDLTLSALEAIKNKSVVQLVMPHRKQWARTRYLCGRKSPRGQYLNWNDDGEIINFDAMDILAYCIANGTTIEINLVSPSGEVYRHPQNSADISPPVTQMPLL